MNFRAAVQATESLRQHYQKGLQALRNGVRARVTCKDTRSLTGSIDLDAALEPALPEAPRWDYGIGIRNRAVWVEVHPASSSHVDQVLEKLRWLKGWLRNAAPKLAALPREFFWLASGKVSLPANSPMRKRIAREGLRFAGERLAIE